MQGGLIGGRFGYQILSHMTRDKVAEFTGPDPYENRSNLESLFGADIWTLLHGKSVLDFGCARGSDAIEAARHGALSVVGTDDRLRLLDIARIRARQAGVESNCTFAERASEPVDVILSIDRFDHHDDPAQVLSEMRRLLKPHGRIMISFGPPWLHPYGGHIFSVFPWAHLIFSEAALIRWRADFKFDGATAFREVEGGLNQMTVRHFERLVAECGMCVETFELKPIKKLALLHHRMTREWLTSVIQCTLVHR